MKSTLNYFLLLLILVNAVNTSFAQSRDEKREKIDALRVTFITQKVSFTKLESQQFWPLYNEMNDKIEANRKNYRIQYNARSNYNFETDKDAEAYLNAELLVKQKEFEIYKEYYERFKKILPIKKVATLRRAEEEFKKEIIKSIKEN